MIVENTINGTHYIHIRCDKCGGIASTFSRGNKKYKTFNTRAEAIANAKENGRSIQGGKMICRICAKE